MIPRLTWGSTKTIKNVFDIYYLDEEISEIDTL
jgi:hypothetical protein